MDVVLGPPRAAIDMRESDGVAWKAMPEGQPPERCCSAKQNRVEHAVRAGRCILIRRIYICSGWQQILYLLASFQRELNLDLACRA